MGTSVCVMSAHATQPAGMESAVTSDAVRARLAGLSVPWVGNAGQWDARAAWRAQTFAGASWVTKDGLLVHEFAGPRAADCAAEDRQADTSPRRRAEACPRGPGWVLTERFVGGRIGPIEGQRPQPGRVSYFTAGREAAELPTFEALDLGEVYRGVRVELKARAGNVEKLYTVAPDREARVIRMRLEGARAVRIAQDGALEAETEHGPVRFTAPVAFQHDARGERREVEVRYALLARTAKAVDYGFELGEYDRSRPLTIDPLLQSTYLGGTGSDFASAIAIHPQSGEVYVAGYTSSAPFPGTTGGAQPSYGGGSEDAFVARYNAALTTLLRTTYLGGSGTDRAHAMAIHPMDGTIYVVGETNSNNFPQVAGGAQTNRAGVYDAFVARFDAGLIAPLQSTYLGGSGNDYAYAIAIHSLTGQVYLVGDTSSNPFPGAFGGAQSGYGGGLQDGFVARLRADLSALLGATHLGGSLRDCPRAVAVHPMSGDVYVAGYTASTNLPGVAGGYQSVYGGGTEDAFVVRFNSELSTRYQATYLGGTGHDYAYGLAIHPASGEIYVGGNTALGYFPVTSNGAQPVFGGTRDGFIARLNPALSVLLASSYVGGSGSEDVYALAIHPVSGDVYVAGATDSAALPAASEGALSSIGGSSDAFVARFNATLTARHQSTYLGGSSTDHAYAIAIHPASGEVYVAGHTYSATLPGTTGGVQTTFGGVNDAFVSRLSLDLRAADVVPDPFVFPAQFGVPVSSLRTAGPVQVTGIAAPAPITLDGALGSAACVSSVAGCSCDLSSGWVVTTNINNNQYLCVQHVSAPSVQTFSETRLVVGGYATKFMTFTGAVPACSLDMDNDGLVTAPKEGLVIARALLGFTQVNAVAGTSITQAQWEAKRAELASCGIVFP